MNTTVNIGQYNTVKLPDFFLPTVIEANKELTEKEKKSVDIYFGSNMNIVVCVAKGKQLSKDNLERIRILTDVR